VCSRADHHPPPPQNIFLTGGNVLFPNFKERLERELLASRPSGSSFAVNLVPRCVLFISFICDAAHQRLSRQASDPLLDAWRGMAAWSAAPQFQQSIITRALYDEHGPQHLVQHMASNLHFIPSPSPTDDGQQHA
jgi:actin-related protein 5